MPDPTRPETRRIWRVVFSDGTSLALVASSRTQALLTAADLCPGHVRIEREGDW